MIDKLESIIKDIKSNFVEYLTKKNRPDLIERLDELFDYEVKETNSKFKVALEYKDQFIFDEMIDVRDFHIIPEKVKNSVRMIFNEELVTTFNLTYDGVKVFEQDLRIGSIGDLGAVLDERKAIIYNAIGFVDVTLLHNKNGELASFNLNISKLDGIRERIKEFEDVIYERYIEVEKKDRQRFYSEGDAPPPPPIVEVLEGNFIVDEFDNFLVDENDNYISWQ